jgi:hypothetical protein
MSSSAGCRRGPHRRRGRGRRRRRPTRASGRELEDECGDADQRERAGDDAVERSLAEHARAGTLHPGGRRAFTGVGVRTRRCRPRRQERRPGVARRRRSHRRWRRNGAGEERPVGHRDFALARDGSAERLLHQVGARRERDRFRRLDVAHQGAEFSVVGWALLGLDRHRSVDRGQEARAVEAGGDHRERAQAIVGEPVRGGRRLGAGDRRVDHGRQGVQVGPRAARRRGLAAVLLDRGEARLQGRRRRMVHRLDRMRRRREAEQDRAERRQQDLVGADVLVPGRALV